MGRQVLVRLMRFVGHHVFSMGTPIGRKLRPELLKKQPPLIRVKPKDLVNAGIARVPKVVGVRDGKPLLADDRTLDVKNIVWSTGYEPGFSWIDIPIFGEDGRPIHECGIVDRAPGLYFVGLHYLYSMTSDTITGVGRDAERIARVIHARKGKLRAA
jgi:putative flavoprotein involved in K+ transport